MTDMSHWRTPTQYLEAFPDCLLIVRVSHDEATRDRDFEKVTMFIEGHKRFLPRALVYSTGTTFNAKQRRGMVSTLSGMRVSFMTDSKKAQYVIRGVSWFNPNVKAFSEMEGQQATSFLELPGASASRLLERLEAVRRVLGVGDALHLQSRCS